MTVSLYSEIKLLRQEMEARVKKEEKIRLQDAVGELNV